MSISDIEKELTDSLADEIRKTIDFNLMCDIMVKLRGFVVVEIDYSPDKKWIDVMEWVDAIVTGEYKEHNGTWLFEKAEDATMFRLRWA